MFKRIFTVTVALLGTSMVWAQGDNLWSLQECIEYAQKNNLTVKQQRLNVQRSEVNLTQARANYYPTFNIGSSYGLNFGRSIDPTTNLFTRQSINSTNLNGSSNMTLFAGGQIRNSVNQAGVDRQAMVNQLESVQNSVLFDVVIAFMNVVLYTEQLENAKLQLGSIQEQVNRTRKLVEAGSLPRSNLLDLVSQQATNELNVVNAENNLSFAVLRLKQLLQIPSSERFEIDVPDIEIDVARSPEQTAEDIYQIALRTMPEIQSADLQVESSILGVEIAKGALYPTLQLSGAFFTNYSSAAEGERTELTGDPPTVVTRPIGYVEGTNERVLSQIEVPSTETYDNDFNRQIYNNFSQSVSLRLFIPIFSNLQNRSNYQRAIIAREQAEIQSEQERNILRQSIETAYNDVVAAAKSYTQSVSRVEAMEESFRATDHRYNLGAANSTEWQIANNNLFQARSDLLRAKYDYIFKQKVLDYYQGKPLEF